MFRPVWVQLVQAQLPEELEARDNLVAYLADPSVAQVQEVKVLPAMDQQDIQQLDLEATFYSDNQATPQFLELAICP